MTDEPTDNAEEIASLEEQFEAQQLRIMNLPDEVDHHTVRLNKLQDRINENAREIAVLKTAIRKNAEAAPRWRSLLFADGYPTRVHTITAWAVGFLTGAATVWIIWGVS